MRQCPMQKYVQALIKAPIKNVECQLLSRSAVYKFLELSSTPIRDPHQPILFLSVHERPPSILVLFKHVRYAQTVLHFNSEFMLEQLRRGE